MQSTNINQAFIRSLTDLKTLGNKFPVRGRDTVELLDYYFSITNPRHRILTCPFRFNNIMATLAELVWVFAGRNDMRYLKRFLPSALDYSDDSYTWRGAYGPRIYGTNDYGISPYDQLRTVIEALKKDPYTRQAIIIIPGAFDYDPALNTRDRPCTVFIQFLFRDNRLHCFVKMRSNDAIWGCFNINVLEWTFLQEVVASILGYESGIYHHNAVSFHYYDDFEKRVDRILSVETPYDVYSFENISPRPLSFTSLTRFTQAMADGCAGIEAVDNGLSFIETKHIIEVISQSFGIPILSYLIPPMAFSFLKRWEAKIAIDLINNDYVSPDIQVACFEYIHRHLRKQSELIETSTKLAYVNESMNYLMEVIETSRYIGSPISIGTHAFILSQYK